MRNLLIFGLITLFLAIGCQNRETDTAYKPWKYSTTVKMDSIRPIGIVASNNGYYVSDGDHNRIVFLDSGFNITPISIQGLERPMHIDLRSIGSKRELLIPEYGRDSIAIYKETDFSYLDVPFELDAPAGVSSFEQEIAIADFYNNRVLYFDGSNWSSFGTPGKGDGEFNYPTDVQITEDKIYVADAYNHRVQIFNKEGIVQRVIGLDKKMNASTGIHVFNQQVAVTDFENDRVLVFDKLGNVNQIIEKDIHKPTDVLLNDNQMLILNYQKGELVIYSNE